jgi:hypothetical protein
MLVVMQMPHMAAGNLGKALCTLFIPFALHLDGADKIAAEAGIQPALDPFIQAFGVAD